MTIHRSYNSDGPTVEALLMEAFKRYLSLHPDAAPPAADAHTTGAV